MALTQTRKHKTPKEKKHHFGSFSTFFWLMINYDCSSYLDFTDILHTN